VIALSNVEKFYENRAGKTEWAAYGSRIIRLKDGGLDGVETVSSPRGD